MKKKIAAIQRKFIYGFACFLLLFAQNISNAQTLAFPGAQGFGRFAKGARGVATREVYIVTNLNDAGAGSFRDAVSRPGRIVVFAISGIVYLSSDVVVSPNVTIAGQTAPGEGIVFFNKRVTFSSASNTIARYLRIRLGATGNSGQDASGLSNGSNMIFDHMSFSWAMDEVFSINWDGKGTAPDSITVQNSIIGQGLHRENHSAGGLIQTPDGGKVSLLRNLYISNKTRNPKVKGVNEFVNNVVYNWGNGNRLADNLNYGWSGDAYIMGGSSGVSEVNIINNYFVGGPLTPPSKTTPFSRGTGTFNLFASGNYFDNDKDGQLNGALVPYTDAGYPGITAEAFKAQPFPYPAASPALTAEQAYQLIIDSVGASYPRRDQVDNLMIDEVKSKGTVGMYVYRETDLPLANGGLGNVFSAPAPLDSDSDGMPDAWEEANGLKKNNKQDAVAFNTTYPEYLNIEVYINSLVSITPPVFVKPPSAVTLSATSVELPVPASTIVINWVDNSTNEDYFVIERSEDNVTFTDITHPAANTTSYLDATGLPNKTYYYRIKAVAGTESSVYTTAVVVKTPQIPTAPSAAATPGPVNGFQYAEPVGGKLTLKWIGSTNTEKYEVYFGTSASSLTKKGEVAYSATPSYEVTGLTDLTTYFWRVDAINSKGSTEGTVWSFRTTKDVAPGLVGYWSFNEAEGRVVTDSTAYQNHGILGLDDDDQSIRVAGKTKNALDFATADPNMYVVSIPNKDQLYLDKGSFSLSFWMKANASLLPPDNNSSAYLLCKGSITRNATTGATGKRFDIEFKNKQFRFAIDDDNDAGGGGKDELQTDGTPFFTNDWVHVTAIRDTAAAKLRVYLNGALVKEQSITKAKSGIGEVSSLVIGNIGELEFLATTNKPAPYKGMLDELKIYNYALSYPEIVTLYYGSPIPQKPIAPSHHNMTVEGYRDTLKLTWQGGVNTTKFRLFMGSDANNLRAVADSVPVATPFFALADVKAQTTYFWRVDAIGALGTSTGDVWSFTTGYPAGLIAHYAMDEEGGILAADSSEYANHGTLKDMPNAVWMKGKYKNALGFGKPGSTGGVVIPDASQIRFDKSSFAVSLWVKLPAYNSASKHDAYLFHKGTMENVTAGTGKWYGLQIKDKTLSFGVDDGINKVSADVNITAGTTYDIFNKGWVHIVALRNRDINRIRVYINGVMAKSTDDGAVTGTIGKASDLLIGNSPENKSFPDSLDDVRFYNYALSEAAITKLLNNVPLLKKSNTPDPANGNTTAGPERVNFSWNDPSGAALSYKVFFGTSPDSLRLKGSGLTAPVYRIDSLAPTKKYYWRVEAASDIDTLLSDLWTFTTAADITKPTVITKNITVELNTSGSATIAAADVNNGSHDVYGIDALSVDKTSFTCANIGENVVTLTVKDKYGNEASQTAIVTVNGIKPGKPVIDPADTVICNGFSANLRALVDTAVTYQWYYEGVAISNAKQNSYAAYNAGKYAVQAISAQSCKSDTSDVAMVRISGDTLLTVEKDAELSKGASVQLTASGSEGSITWSPFLASSHKEGRTTTVTPLQTTRYTATLVNALGCKVSRSVLVKVADKFSNEYNNILTPNGDGINDRLVIKNLNGYPNNRLQVFDYSGKVIYQQNGYSNDWDGTINGRKAANGTYYFVLMINNEVKIKGSVTIVN